MNMHPLTLNNRQILIVPLPDGATKVGVVGKKLQWFDGDLPIYSIIEFPLGTYRLLFLSSQATEEDWKGLVYKWRINNFWAYENYGNKQNWYTSAIKSGHSLLSSPGVTNAAVLEKIDNV